MLSVIIINYNTKIMTQRCIDSLCLNTPDNFPYEIIVVDNSTDHKEVFEENGAVKVKCDDTFSILEYATVSVRPENMRFDSKPHEGFELVAFVKDYIYVGSVLKCIVILPNGNELKIERLAGQELPTIGSRIYPYWDPEGGVLIHNDSYKIFKALDEIKLA